MDIVDLLDTTPALVIIDGKLKHRWIDGTITPVVRGGAEGDPPDPDPDPDPPEFRPITSQEELNRVVRDRVSRAEAAARQGQPTASELEELRRKAKEHDDAQAANQSELDRERTGRETAEAERTRLQAENVRIRNEAAIIAAASATTGDPAAAAVLILADPEKYAVTLDDAGLVTDADTAVKTLLEDKPFLSASAANQVVDSGQGRHRGDRGGTPSGLAAGRERYAERNGTKK